MSKPFIQACKDIASRHTNEEIEQRLGQYLLSWSMLSTSKMVSLDQVAWLGAAIVKGAEMAGLAKQETRDAHGARVVGIVADDGVRVADGAR